MFDFQRLHNLLGHFVSIVSGNRELIQLSGVDDIQQLRKSTFEDICTVGINFSNQLRGLFSENVLPADDPAIIERITKASTYFQEKMATGLYSVLPKIGIETDNKEIRKKAKNTLKWLREESDVKMAAVECCENTFSPSLYLRAISAAEVSARQKKEPKITATYSEADIEHPELASVMEKLQEKSENLRILGRY